MNVTTRPTRPTRLAFISLWLPVLLCILAIFIASVMSYPPTPEDVPDVGLHGLAYFGLAVLLIRAIAGGTWKGVTLATLTLAWLVAVAYGATDEWHQSFVANRHAELRDLGADAIGAGAAAIAAGACSIIRRS
jgi:VanZ family protein